MSGSDANTTVAFVAGYMAAIQSQEYRIGVISTNDAAGQTYRRAFENGVIYFCGNCTPVFPPYEIYPVYVELPPGASPTELEAAAEVLFSRRVTMVHIAPSLQSDDIYQYIAKAGALLVGTAPPPAGLEGNWVGSVMAEAEMGLGAVLQAVAESGSQGQVGASVRIDYTGASSARVGHLEEIIRMVEDGTIDPVGVVN
jgi:hypothetical protein